MKHKSNPLNSKIIFKTEGALHISIETKRLLIESVTKENEADLISLYSDPIVMQKYNRGVPRDSALTKTRVYVWTYRWAHHDPFSMYSISDKITGEFIGCIGIQYSEPGETELDYCLHHKFWGKGYATEAVDAILHHLIPRLMLRGYHIDHKPLKRVIATARVDNPASTQILKSAEFKEGHTYERFGSTRTFFSLYTKPLKNDYHQFFAARDVRPDYHEPADISDSEMAQSVFGRQAKRNK
jgi:RimJ/RimL family protein N-acetyltransferase